MPTNSYTVSCSDPALIEDTAFVCMIQTQDGWGVVEWILFSQGSFSTFSRMCLAASLEKVRARI